MKRLPISATLIGKVISGKSFGGCIAYNLNREQAYILDAAGVRTASVKQLTDDFNLQRSLRPNLSKAVGHIILSWSAADSSKLNDEIMVLRAKEYREQMKITDTQYLLVRHTDRQHPHVHLIYNRVANDGKVVTDAFQKLDNQRVCKDLTLKYGYHLAQGKEQVNRQRLKGADQLKYQLYDQIKRSLATSHNWQELEANLKSQDIGIHYKQLSGTTKIQGVSFSTGSAKFKGSEIDRSLSFSKIDTQLKENELKHVLKPHKEQKLTLGYDRTTNHNKSYLQQQQQQPYQNHSLLDSLLEQEQNGSTEFEQSVKKRQRKKSKGLRI